MVDSAIVVITSSVRGQHITTSGNKRSKTSVNVSIPLVFLGTSNLNHKENA
jgi:hypothetical protein